MSMAWRLFTETALRDGPPLGADRYLELRYESLVTDPTAVGERVLDFLGIDRPDSRATLIAAVGRADPGSVGAWRSTFDDEATRVLMDDAGALLEQLGYR